MHRFAAATMKYLKYDWGIWWKAELACIPVGHEA